MTGRGAGSEYDTASELRLAADAVVPVDAAGAVLRPGAVHGEAGRITYVGPPDGSERRVEGLLMPGFVDCHCHSPMTLFRGAAEDVPLQRFLREVLWPREARLTPDDVYWGMTLACAELLRGGVTTTCEMYFHEQATLRAVVDAGLRCVITPGVLDVPGFVPWRGRLEEVLALRSEEPTVEVGIAAHSAYALPEEGLAAIAAAALERDLLLHIHVAETRDEGRELEARHGKSVPALLEELGVLECRVLAAHCVWLSEDDRRLFGERDVAVAHCPTSNAKLACGIAPVSALLADGVRVGLGTDGPSSNNDLDLWEEMRLAALLARLATGDAGTLPAAEALALATRWGGDALGLPVGALEPGRRADVVRVRTDDAAFAPVVQDRDLVSHLVWSASSRLVADVWVEGRQVVADGRSVTVDEERARREVQDRAARLAA
jgi:5-methylthioadenosine/S-adenosylhomocysteine deaminase